MTTCPEVYLAKELGLPYASIAIGKISYYLLITILIKGRLK